MLWTFRIVITIVGVFFFYYLRRVMFSGKALRHRGKDAGFNLSSHLNVVNRTLQISLFTLILVEGFGLFLHRIHDHPPIFWIHIAFFAGPFLILLLVLRFWLTGQKNPAWHNRLVYPCLTCGAGANILGIYMAWFILR